MCRCMPAGTRRVNRKNIECVECSKLADAGLATAAVPTPHDHEEARHSDGAELER